MVDDEPDLGQLPRHLEGRGQLPSADQQVVNQTGFPDRLDAYANTIRKLGNVGTHTFGEKVTVAAGVPTIWMGVL